MNLENYTEKEIEEVVNSFKSFIKNVTKNARIDYERKLKSKKYRLVSINEIIEKEMSLSRVDDGIFHLKYTKDLENIFSEHKFNRAFKKLTEKERKILYLYSEKYSPYQISKILKITRTNVTTIKNRAIKKFKKFISEGNEYEN